MLLLHKAYVYFLKNFLMDAQSAISFIMILLNLTNAHARISPHGFSHCNAKSIHSVSFLNKQSCYICFRRFHTDSRLTFKRRKIIKLHTLCGCVAKKSEWILYSGSDNIWHALVSIDSSKVKILWNGYGQLYIVYVYLNNRNYTEAHILSCCVILGTHIQPK